MADSLKKLSMCEASLEVNTRYRSDLEEEKVRTQKDMDRLRGKVSKEVPFSNDIILRDDCGMIVVA